jgi:hypothetical protein
MKHLPRAVAFDVIETLFALDPVRVKLKEAGLGGDALQVWYARTLRDGMVLTQRGDFKSFPEVATGKANSALDATAGCEGRNAAGSRAETAVTARRLMKSCAYRCACGNSNLRIPWLESTQTAVVPSFTFIALLTVVPGAAVCPTVVHGPALAGASPRTVTGCVPSLARTTDSQTCPEPSITYLLFRKLRGWCVEAATGASIDTTAARRSKLGSFFRNVPCMGRPPRAKGSFIQSAFVKQQLSRSATSPGESARRAISLLSEHPEKAFPPCPKACQASP